MPTHATLVASQPSSGTGPPSVGRHAKVVVVYPRVRVDVSGMRPAHRGTHGIANVRLTGFGGFGTNDIDAASVSAPFQRRLRSSPVLLATTTPGHPSVLAGLLKPVTSASPEASEPRSLRIALRALRAPLAC